MSATAVQRATDGDVDQLRELEERRCRAVSELDLATLSEILDADLSHTHVVGRTEDRETYLRELVTRPRTTTVGEMTVRHLGDTALMTGTLRNTRPGPDGDPAGESPGTDIHALRVWRRAGSSWTLIAFAASGPIR